jgi:hypothetical protein
MGMIGESYPFFRGNYYMTIIGEENDTIREFAICKESKVIPMPETWLNLRIKGSQHSQFLRRKCKHIPRGFSLILLLSMRPDILCIGYQRRTEIHGMLSLMPQAWFLEKTDWPLHSTALTSCYVHLLSQSFSINLPSGNK